MSEQSCTDAKSLRDSGIIIASQSAERSIKGWNDMALNAVYKYAIEHSEDFMAEDVRKWAVSIPNPPSNRAWGGVMVTACRLGFIKKVGYGLTKNPTAHRTPATVWSSIIL